MVPWQPWHKVNKNIWLTQIKKICSHSSLNNLIGNWILYMDIVYHVSAIKSFLHQRIHDIVECQYSLISLLVTFWNDSIPFISLHSRLSGMMSLWIVSIVICFVSVPLMFLFFYYYMFTANKYLKRMYLISIS